MKAQTDPRPSIAAVRKSVAAFERARGRLHSAVAAYEAIPEADVTRADDARLHGPMRLHDEAARKLVLALLARAGRTDEATVRGACGVVSGSTSRPSRKIGPTCPRATRPGTRSDPA